MKRTLPVLILMLTGVAACAGAPPYVDRPYEINRENASFPDGPPILAGSGLTVCYAKSQTTPEQIRALADGECATVGLQAVFIRQSLDICPMMTPIAAEFRCEATVAGRRWSAPATSRSSVPVIATPSFAAPRPAGAGRPLGTIGAADVSTTAKSQPFPTYLFNNPQPAR